MHEHRCIFFPGGRGYIVLIKFPKRSEGSSTEVGGGQLCACRAGASRPFLALTSPAGEDGGTHGNLWPIYQLSLGHTVLKGLETFSGAPSNQNTGCKSMAQRFCFHFSIWNGLLRKFHTQIWISSFSWKTGKRSDNPGAETTALLEDHHLESRRCLFQAVFDTPALLPAWDWSRINLLYLQACASFLLTVKKKVKYFLYPWFYLM